MRPDFEQEPVRIDGFSPCPGCGEVGFSIEAWTHLDSGRPIKKMQCSTDDSECRVDEYLPEWEAP